VKHTARRQFTPENLEAVLAAEKRPVLRALWLFLASTGLRPGEARTLLWQDLYEQADGYWVKLRESKTEEGKEAVPIAAVMMGELHSLPKTSLYVFPTAAGEPYNESNLRREWVRVLDAAEVPFTNLYQLRKLFGTLKARAVPDTILKRLMRHKDARTTKQFYVTALEADLRNAVEN
jgi:integrase